MGVIMRTIKNASRVMEQVRANPELVLPVPPLTKEQAMADTLRALKECFPDRWERVWAALGAESAADKGVAAVAKATADNPRAAAGALAGALLGAALAGGTRPR